MSDEIAINVDDVSKTFRLPNEKQASLKSSLINFRNRGYKEQQVLNNVSFNVKKGEFFGIVGRNGSGKSTLLKLLAGIYSPTKGGIAVNGKLTPFIELGVGFSPELSGRENVFLNGALLGFNRTEMEGMYKDIVTFAEIEGFMDQKLKNYSSGMQVRLAFAIAVRARSDILVLDEVLAVGDAAFQRKCYDYFMSLKKEQRTVVLVTHDMGAVRQYCDRAIMIEKGKIVKAGSPEKVSQAYQKLFSDESETRQRENSKNPHDTKNSEDRWGDGSIVAIKVRANIWKDDVIIQCTYQAYSDVPPPIYGISIYNTAGVNVVESNTEILKLATKPLKKGENVTFTWKVPNIFASGNYAVSLACCDQSKTNFYDWLNQGVMVTINKETTTASIVDLDITVEEGNKDVS